MKPRRNTSKKMLKLAVVCAPVIALASTTGSEPAENNFLRRKRSDHATGEAGGQSSEDWKLEHATMAMGDIWEHAAARAQVELDTVRLLQSSGDMSMPTRAPIGRPPTTPRPNISPTPAPMSGPTPAPFDCLMGRSREEYIFDLLVPITSARLLNDPSTPQGMAFDYLANEDPHLQDPCSSSTIEQRYGLTTIFYSTQGNEWIDQQGWLGQDPECEWAGVECLDNSGIVSRLLLPNNNMIGSIPNEVLTLDKLERLDFYTNAITGTLPEGIASLTNLILFDIEQNLLTGPAFPDALFDMRALVAYRISDNFVSGTIAREISTMQNLQQLWASTNVLSGTIPTQIASPPNLQSIFLYENALIGTIPSEMGLLTDLEDLRLYSNTLQSTIPPGLFSATNLQALMLEFNFFSGMVPGEIGQVTNLVDLRLDTNSLTGPFPTELGRLSMLENFIINNNFMSGQIPNVFNNFQRLDFFDVSNNLFFGSVPETIFNIDSLRLCYMSNNTLTGTIPPEFSQPPLLRDLYLDGNGLTGTVPSILTGELEELNEMLLHFNALTGVMPDSICALRGSGGNLDDLFTDCGGLNPEIQCPFPSCCNRCFERGSVARRGVLQMPRPPGLL